MANDSALNIILRFLTDQKSVKAAKEAIKQVEVGASGIGKSAKAASSELSQIARDVLDFQQLTGHSLEKAAESFAFSTGKTKEEIIGAVQAMGQVEKKTEDVTQKTRTHEQQIRAVRRQYVRLGEDAFRLNRLGITLGIIGAAISGPLILSATKAVKTLGLADATTRQWLDSTSSLEASQIRIGRVAAQAILPVMERIAAISERAAEFAEDNPDAVRNVLAVGGALVGIGAITSAVSRGIKLYADIKILTAAALQNTAADKMLAAANIQAGAAVAQGRAAGGGLLGKFGGGLATAGAIGGGILAGFGINELLKNLLGPKSGLASFGQFATVGAFGLGNLISPEKGQEWAFAIGTLTGAINDMADAADDASGKVQGRIIPQEAVDAFIQFQRQNVEAERQYGQQRAQIVAQFGQRRVEIEAQYEAQRAQLVSDFGRSQAQALADFRLGQSRAARDFAQSEGESVRQYYDRRKKLAEEFQIDVQRAEEDHQRRIRKLQEDHEERLEDLVDERDALGILREERKFEKDRRQLEEEFQVEAARRSEDFARRIAEQEQQFAQERSNRAAQFAQRQADEAADFQRRRQQEQAAFQERLQELDDQHKEELKQLETQKRQQLQELERTFNEERIKRQRAFADQLRDLGGALGFERDLRNRFYEAMAQDLAAWIAVWEGQVGSLNPGFPGRQFGGYTGSGLYRLHSGEFVINPTTTRKLERMTGGRLDQERILAAVSNGGMNLSGGRTQIVIHQHASFEGTFTERDRKDFRKMARDASEELFIGAMPL